MDHTHGKFTLSMLVFTFGLRNSESDARASILNGVVKVNGKKVVNPAEQFSLVRLNELQCGQHIIEFNRKS